MPPPSSLLREQRGATLIEVLVAILLVALGILAMAAMQVNSTRVAKTSEFRAMGALLAADLADRMRANRAAVYHRADESSAPSNQYQFALPSPRNDADLEITAPTSCNQSDSDCTSEQLAAYDLQAWRLLVASSMPGGWARVSNIDTSDNGVDVWLMWVDVEGTLNTGDSAACPDKVVAEPEEGEPATTVAPRCMYFRVNL